MDRAALPDLTFVRDIEAFEGPILSEYDGADGVPYLEKWCAYVDGAVRYLVVRSHRDAIEAYLRGHTSMLDLLLRPSADVGWLVDCVGQDVVRVETVRVSEVPDSYLPEPGTMHDEDLRPVGFKR